MADKDLVNFTTNIISKEVFTCAICKEILKIPIILVEEIGNLCNICYETNHVKNKWKGVPNNKLDIILNDLKIPCKYEQKGCKQWFSYTELNEHQNNCRFIVRKCLMKNCEWEGLQENISKHFTEEHAEHIVTGLNNSFLIELDISENFSFLKLIKGDNQSKDPIIFRILFDKNLNCFFYKFYSLNSDHEYALKLKFKGSNGKYLKAKCDLLPFKNIYEDFSENDVKIDLTALKGIIEITNKISLKLKAIFRKPTQDLDEKMLHFFECPVCKNLMKPPIYQCNSGHSFCNVCRPRLEKCPTCRGVFGNVRNYSLESLTVGIKYPCMYHNYGCPEILSATEMNKHENSCVFKSHSCPLSNCNFAGNHSSIVSHLKTNHLDKVILSDYYKTSFEYRLDQYSDMYTFERLFFIIDNDIFRLSFKRNTDYCFWAVEVLGNGGNCENLNYVYEIGIIDMRKQNRKLIRTDLCFKDITSEDLFKKCILFPNNILNSYSTNGKITYYCKIHKC